MPSSNAKVWRTIRELSRDAERYGRLFDDANLTAREAHYRGADAEYVSKLDAAADYWFPRWEATAQKVVAMRDLYRSRQGL